jgi:hypothetical protein
MTSHIQVEYAIYLIQQIEVFKSVLVLLKVYRLNMQVFHSMKFIVTCWIFHNACQITFRASFHTIVTIWNND